FVIITIRKAQKFVREQERRPGRARRGRPSQGLPPTLLVDAAVEQVADPKPFPDLELLANETIEHLLRWLGSARLRSVAVWNGEGYSNEEIASMLCCSSRTVQRKLDLIRTIWNDAEARSPAEDAGPEDCKQHHQQSDAQG